MRKHIFSWIPAYQAIVEKIRGLRHNQNLLLQTINDLGIEIKDDQSAPGENIPLGEIDPFTFLCYFNYFGDTKRKKLLIKLCDYWKIPVEVKDVCGLPTVSGQKIWLFPWQYERTHNEIDRLWDFFESLLNDTITDQQFLDVLQIKNIGKAKLTEVMFMVLPIKHLCLNGAVIPYLNEIKGIQTTFNTYAEYQNILISIGKNCLETFPEISYEGYLHKAFANRSPNYYRLGSKEGKEDRYPEMVENGIVSIGWSDIGDIDFLEPNNRSTINQKMIDLGYNINKKTGEQSKSTISTKAGEIFRFYNELKPNDIILINDGRTVKGIAKVYSHNYVFLSGLKFPHGRLVDFLDTEVKELEIEEGLRSTIWKLSKKESIKAINKYLGISISEQPGFENVEPLNESDNMELNTIVYGPPGTGKTYSTLERAIRIVNSGFVFPDDKHSETGRKIITDEFKRLRRAGFIEFVTFHQSMSYEDFIEGIKPIIPGEETDKESDKDDLEDSKMIYDVVPGVFKRLCEKARMKDLQEFDFDDLWKKFTDQILADGQEVIFTAVESEMRLERELSSENSLKVRFKKSYDSSYDEGQRVFPAGKETVRKIFEKRINLNDPNVQPRKAILNVVGNGRATIFLGVYRSFFEFNNLGSLFEESQEKKPYVLIIDEINRGNVSQIFGELITLIETDKREGKKEALSLTLPYSKKEFSVPSNVHLIGTMNTADRSVEALDSALRRRFSFEFLPPDESKVPELLGENIPLRKVFSAINDRLTYLLDEDHQIGHSYFISIKDLDDLKHCFQNKIIPLLREYFFKDFGKIRMVLGNGFVNKSNPNSSKPIFAVSDSDYAMEKEIFTIQKVDSKFDIESALKMLLPNATA